jgi:surfactin synthase thioesterase subunit
MVKAIVFVLAPHVGGASNKVTRSCSADEELMTVLLPVLRADFDLCEQ